MESKSGLAGTALIMVRHPQIGTHLNGNTICEQVRILLGRHSGPVWFFHDASEMNSADIEYAAEFRRLDGDLAGRDVRIVCAIPTLLPRIMALTVSKVSRKRWDIFKLREEAVDFLTGMGVDDSLTALPRGNVDLRLIAENAVA